MRHISSRFALTAVLLSALTLGACSGSNVKSSQDPLLGTWIYSGQVPSFVDITLTFKADKTFTFVEQISPASEPAGFTADGCVTTHSFSATYAEATASGANTLDWTFTSGTANAVAGCNDASNDSAGTPLTTDAISSYIMQGDVPPMSLTYTTTSTTLILTSSHANAGVAGSRGTTFMRTD